MQARPILRMGPLLWLINFLIIAFVVFMLVRYVNKVKEAAEEEAAPAPEGTQRADRIRGAFGNSGPLKK